MKKVLSQILIVFLGVFVLVFVLFKAGTVGPQFLNASYYGGAINLINILAALYAFNYSVDKENKTFLLFNMGGDARQNVSHSRICYNFPEILEY